MGDFIADSHATVCCYAVFFSQEQHMHKGGLGSQLGYQARYQVQGKNTKLKKLQF